MSLTTTEYKVQRRMNGEVKSNHGPYDTLENAERQRIGGERYDADRRKHEQNPLPPCEWVILERDVTPWSEVPSESPA